MSSFTNGLICKWMPDIKKFKVFIPFEYHVGSEDSDEIIRIPEGYLSDLASIPPPASWLIPKLGKHAQAGVLHDFMYEHHLYDRKTCDLIFLEAMEVLKVPRLKRILMFRAVRLFGWIFY